VAAEEAAGAPPPRPSSDAADARIAVPTTMMARPTASPAARMPPHRMFPLPTSIAISTPRNGRPAVAMGTPKHHGQMPVTK